MDDLFRMGQFIHDNSTISHIIKEKYMLLLAVKIDYDIKSLKKKPTIKPFSGRIGQKVTMYNVSYTLDKITA